MNLTDENKITRKKIVDVARRLSEADGLFNLSVKDVATEAEVSEETFYKFFKDIDELIRELLLTRSGLTDENILRLPIEEKIKKFNFILAVHLETGGLKNFSKWIHDNIQRHENPLLTSDKEILRKLLNSSIEAHELIPDTPVDDIVEFIVSLNYGIGINWCMTNTKFEPLEHLDAMNNLIINSLIPYLIR